MSGVLLPTELRAYIGMVGRLEFESRTCGLKGRCSTVELATQSIVLKGF